MSRKLTSHKVNGLNEALVVRVNDEPGQGNACHSYTIHADDSIEPSVTKPGITVHQTIAFQNGPIGEVGVNGVSNEALLAVVEDRLIGFQSGPYACRDNAVALTKIQEAMMWLQKRTRERMARGVEGTHQV